MLYTVGEIAKILHIPASTLRYYDKEGLLPLVERSKGGIRMFSDKDYEWLKVIDMVERGDDSLSERLALFRSRKNAVQKQIQDMEQTLELLEFKCWYYEQSVNDGTEVNVRSLTIDEIPVQYQKLKKNMDTITKNND